MNKKEIIATKLAEWGVTLSDSEVEQLAPAYEKLLRWQTVLEEMLRSRGIADGMVFPESEPLLIHALEKKRGRNDNITRTDVCTDRGARGTDSAQGNLSS